MRITPSDYRYATIYSPIYAISYHKTFHSLITMNTVKFIVALATFKREELLKRALNSISQQDYPNIEVIVVDDSGVKPEKKFVDDSLGGKLHYFYHEANLGVNQARNTLVKKAKELDPSAYMVFIDDDDYLTDGALSIAAKTIKEHPEFVWFTMDCTHPNGKKISKLNHYGKLSYLDDYMFGKDLRGDMLHIVKTDAIGDARYSDQFKNGEIWYFWCQLSVKHPLYAIQAVGCVKEFLDEGITKTGFNRDRIISVLEYKIATLEPIVGFKKLKHQYITLAKHLLKGQRKQEAKALLTNVFKQSPGYTRQYKHWIKYFLS